MDLTVAPEGEAPWAGLEDLKKNWRVDRVFDPGANDAIRVEGYRQWKRAVERARGWIVKWDSRKE